MRRSGTRKRGSEPRHLELSIEANPTVCPCSSKVEAVYVRKDVLKNGKRIQTVPAARENCIREWNFANVVTVPSRKLGKGTESASARESIFSWADVLLYVHTRNY